MRIGHHRRYTANHTWHVTVGKRKLFVKANPTLNEARQEILGHHRIRDHYPVPELLSARGFSRWTFLTYRRWPHVAVDEGLLLDEITHADCTHDIKRFDACIDDIIGHYRTVIAGTLRRAAQSDTIIKLYGDRAAPGGRLDVYYSTRSPWTSVTGDPDVRKVPHLIVNGRRHTLDFDAIRTMLGATFENRVPIWAAVTQGDPTDFNIGWSPNAGPVWLDYDTGGLSALAGEFACFLLYQRLHGAWLTPTYNFDAFCDHPASLTDAARHRPTVHLARHERRVLTIDYSLHPSFARQHLMRRYMYELVRPMAALLGITDLMDWLRP